MRTAEPVHIRPHSAMAVTVIKRTVRQGASSLATETCKMHGYQPTHSPLPYCHSLALSTIASSDGPQTDHRSHTQTMVVTPVFWIRTTWPSLQSVYDTFVEKFCKKCSSRLLLIRKEIIRTEICASGNGFKRC